MIQRVKPHRVEAFWEDVNEGERQQYVVVCRDCGWDCDFPDWEAAEAGRDEHLRATQ